MDQAELARYARERWGTEAEHLFPETPETYILRHRENRKWYAVVMRVPKGKLGLAGEEEVFLLDVKCGPLLSGSYMGKPGVVPAWHMNKTHWLGVLLDGSASRETVLELLEISYRLTGGNRRKGAKA